MNTLTKLHSYRWQGINRQGEILRGEYTALNPQLLKTELRRQGILVRQVKKNSALFAFSARIRSNDITLFSRQLATLLLAGIPLMQSLELIQYGYKKLALKNLIHTIKLSIENGNSIANALQQHPRYFNEFYCSLIAVGEKSGTLDIMLERIATWKEKTDQLKSKIKKALFYPIAVITVAIIITVILLLFVVPQFVNLFASFGATLPLPTQLIIKLAQFLQRYGWLCGLCIGLSIIGFLLLNKKFAAVAQSVDHLLLRLPLIGKIVQKTCVARFARTLMTTIAAGIPLSDALQVVAGATGNYHYTQSILSVQTAISKGEALHLAIQQTKRFPVLVEQLIGIGEETGKLENMLNKIADIFEKEVDNAVDTLNSLLEPFIMVVLGIIIGGLVIAMYLPIFKLSNIM